MYLDNTASWAWQQLSIGKLATVDCWAEVYVENLSSQAVWFDDLEIATGALPTALVVQETHYDPWGLELAGIGYNASGNPEHDFKFQGKELVGDFGLGWYDFQWRQYDPVLGRFNSVDPMAHLMRRVSPFAFVFNNPLRFIDPDGMVPGDFYEENGNFIGNDGRQDGKVYVIKTTKTNFDGAPPVNGITRDQRKATVSFIKENTGNTEMFPQNSVAYQNSVEIEGNRQNRQLMVDIVTQDTGKGGTDPANNREHGGIITTNGVVRAELSGPVTNPRDEQQATIELSDGADVRSQFHSHPSGSVTEYTKKETNTVQMSGTASQTWSFTQTPSHGTGLDINPERTPRTNYVFGMSSGTVYIYNSQSGIQATLPMKKFVNLPQQ
jgi:RHS repeat-associated protein